jgi:hypothetical protein
MSSPANPSLRASRAVSLSSGSPMEQADAGRSCAHPDCPTRLSRYNPDATCATHGGWSVDPQPRRRRRTVDVSDRALG